MGNMTEERLQLYLYLKDRIGAVKDELEQAVFVSALGAYEAWLYGCRQSKSIRKEDIIRYCIKLGLLRLRQDPVTGNYDKLPDDREVRAAARMLLRAGYPVMATSGARGYFIADSEAELEWAQRENGSRIEKLELVNAGIERAKALFV